MKNSNIIMHMDEINPVVTVVECQRCKKDYIPINRDQRRHCKYCHSNNVKLNTKKKGE